MFDDIIQLATKKLLRFHGTIEDPWITPVEFISVAFSRKYKPSPRAFEQFHDDPNHVFLLVHGLLCKKNDLLLDIPLIRTRV